MEPVFKREQWKSRLGFIWAAVGSAIGLGSIWRFPYVVGQNGGATFVVLYLICLILVGFPVLVSEILVGRTAALNPSGAFLKLGKNRKWQGIGKMTILTGFLVSSFYAVIAGWTLGYFLESLLGHLGSLSTSSAAQTQFLKLTSSPFWSVGFLFGFLLLAIFILYTGVQHGIEAGNKIMMPLLLFVLIFLAIKGLTFPKGEQGLTFLFKPSFSDIRAETILMALGQAFFSLSLGQGTMVTYGSYLPKKENIPGTCLPIAFFGICVSLLAGIAIFTIVFAFGLPVAGGESLMFQTLPLIFSKIPAGYLLSLLFFLLLLLAALTSQISAMEPLIAYLIDARKWSRHRATLTVGLAVFIVALPCALSFGPLKGWTLFGKTLFDLILYLCLNILIPLGGLGAVLLIGWKWGIKKTLPALQTGGEALFKRLPFLPHYFKISIKFIAPLIIVLILLDAIGVF